LRYISAMATIQVRDLPEETYEVLRRRARRAGQSMQAYMRDQLVTLAARPTKQETVATIEAILDRGASEGRGSGEERGSGEDPEPASIVDDLAADRR
jgi:antitoxin FitA